MSQAAWAARTLSAVRALTPPPKEGEHAAGAGGAGAACAGPAARAAARAAWAAVGGPGALGRRWAHIVHSLERAASPDSPSLQRLPPLHTHLCMETRHLTGGQRARQGRRAGVSAGEPHLLGRGAAGPTGSLGDGPVAVTRGASTISAVGEQQGYLLAGAAKAKADRIATAMGLRRQSEPGNLTNLMPGSSRADWIAMAMA